MKIFTYRILLIQLFIISSLFFFSQESIGQVSDPVLVRLDETNSTDRQTLLAKETALLERNLDDSYFQTTSDGKLYFRFLEKYVDAKLEVSVYDWQRTSLLTTSVDVSKQYGENWYVLNGQVLNLELNQYYFVEVKDENKQKTVLRFKYVLEFTPLKLSCQGTGTECDKNIGIANPTIDVPVNASIEEGVGPFKITWTLIKENGDGSFTEVILKEETTSEMNHSYVVSGWESPYKIQFKVVDACRNEKSCIFCVTSPTDGRISSEKQSKFFLFFKIKTDKKDKDKTNPTPSKDKNNTNNVN